MSKTWVKKYCPKCNTINWRNLGDFSDIEKEDIEAIRCRKCKYVFLIGQKNKTWEDFPDIINPQEDTNWETGKEKPD